MGAGAAAPHSKVCPLWPPNEVHHADILTEVSLSVVSGVSGCSPYMLAWPLIAPRSGIPRTAPERHVKCMSYSERDTQGPTAATAAELIIIINYHSRLYRHHCRSCHCHSNKNKNVVNLRLFDCCLSSTYLYYLRREQAVRPVVGPTQYTPPHTVKATFVHYNTTLLSPATVEIFQNWRTD